jgi:Bacterial Ig-like domain (group 3)/FG-GAP-like repeat
MKLCRGLVVVVLLPVLLVSPASALGAARLPAPTITSAVATTATSIDVSWTVVDRATGYEVRWTAYGEVDSLTTSSTSARLAVFAATPYTIEVRALGRNAASPWSIPVYLTTPPAPPSSVVGTAVRPDLVQVTWQTGYGEARYEVYAVAGDGSLDGPLQTWSYSGEVSRVFVATAAETTTSYVVLSVGYDGQRSAPSEAVTVTTPPRWSSGVVIAVYGPFDEGTVTLNAYVQTSPDDRFATLGGEMTFTIDGGEPRTVPLAGGSASIQAELVAGRHEVAVSWTGDTAYLPSSTTTTIEVRPVLAALTEPEVLSASGATYDAAVGDVTGDGRPDLATVVSGDSGNLLQVRAGQADGSLADPISRAVPFGTQELALGDLDRDGNADAVLPSADGVLVSAGSPTGFGAPSLPRTTAPAIDVGIADLTGDGLADVVVGTTAGLHVLPGTGRLSTGKSQTIAAATVSRIEIGNLTGDTRLEVAGVASTPDEQALVVWTPTTGGWTQAFREPAVGVGDVAVGDVTGDGLADLAWTGPADYPDSQTQLRTGPAFTRLTVPYAPPVSGVGMGDLDGDGRDNLVAGPDSWSQAQVWRVTGNEVSPPAPVELGFPYLASSVLVTDVSGDGLDDLLILDQNAGLVIIRRAG